MRAHVAPSERQRRTHPARAASTWAPAATTSGKLLNAPSRSTGCSHGASWGRGPGGLPLINSAHSATHSSQMKTPGPATRVPTSVLGFKQNEHEAITRRSSAGAIQGDSFLSGVTLQAVRDHLTSRQKPRQTRRLGTELASQALVVHLSANGALLGTTKSSSRGIGAIACSTSTICMMAVANGTAPEKMQLLSSGHFGTTHTLPANTYVQAMSCYKAALCYALAGTKSSGLSDELFSLNPKTGAVGTMITLSGLHGNAIACSSATECQVLGFKLSGAVATSGVIAVSHGKAGAFKDYPDSLSDIACPTATLCYAVGTSSGRSVIDRI